MKKIITILILLLSVDSIAQDTILTAETSMNKDNIYFMNHFRTVFIIPEAIGDNYIAEGQDGRFGVGLKSEFFSIYNFILGVGGEFVSYKVIDDSFGGNYDHTFINTLYIEAMYNVAISKKISIAPKAQIGYSSLFYNKSGNGGWQDGFRYGAGLYIDYRLFNRFSFFAGADYLISRPQVETNAAYQDFFGKVEHLNVLLGLKVIIR